MRRSRGSALGSAAAGLGLAALGSIALGGCDAPRAGRAAAEAGASPLDCFPAAARPFLPHATDAPARAAGASPGSATVYVDGSGSMAGFLRAATGRERPLQDLVSPDLLSGALGGPTAFRRFGEAIHPVAPSEVAALAAPESFACAAGRPCDNAESRLDRVFAEVAAQPAGAVSLVVTDLWLANPQARTSGVVDMAAPLARIFETGRSVAVYGLAAPYAGRVYDLPSGRADVTAARRPLFLVAVGPDARLRSLDDGLRASPSELLQAGLADGRVRRSLFTRTPGAVGGARSLSAPGGGGPLAAAPVLAAREGVRIAQLTVSRRAAREAASGRGPASAGAPPRWSGPEPAGLAPGAVWSGPLKPQLVAFESRGETCRADRDWRDFGALPGGWTAGAGGRWSFALTPATLGDLRPGRYLLVGSLVRTGLDQPNPADRWMRDWSFAPGDPERVGADGVFPVLNLAETARVLETALAADARARPAAVDGWTAAVRVTE